MGSVGKSLFEKSEELVLKSRGDLENVLLLLRTCYDVAELQDMPIMVEIWTPKTRRPNCGEKKG